MRGCVHKQRHVLKLSTREMRQLYQDPVSVPFKVRRSIIANPILPGPRKKGAQLTLPRYIPSKQDSLAHLHNTNHHLSRYNTWPHARRTNAQKRSTRHLHTWVLTTKPPFPMIPLDFLCSLTSRRATDDSHNLSPGSVRTTFCCYYYSKHYDFYDSGWKAFADGVFDLWVGSLSLMEKWHFGDNFPEGGHCLFLCERMSLVCNVLTRRCIAVLKD